MDPWGDPNNGMIFWKGKYCAYKVCKHDCRSKNLGYQDELKAVNLDLFG